MLDTDQIKAALVDRKIAVVAKQTGICRATIYNMLNGKSSPLHETARKLSDYLEGKDR